MSGQSGDAGAGAGAGDAAAAMPTGNENVIFPIERQSQVDVLVVSAVFIALPTIAVGLRLLARRIAHRSLDASDYCIIAACTCANALQAVAIVGVVQGGVGYHFQEIAMMYGMAPITKFLKLLIPVQLLWAISLSLCKISILLLLARIFTMRAMVYMAFGTAGFIACWALATILSGFFICRPFALNWDQTLDGYCGDQVLSYLITGSMNLVTDVVVLLLPLPYLWSLQLRLYKKLVLLATFSMGIFTIVISALRLKSLRELDYADITYNIPHALIFGALEPSVGVTLACIPLLRPLLGRSKYSGNGTVQYHGSTDNPSGAMRSGNAVQKKGFAPLEDDSSQYQLRPMGGKHNTTVSSGLKGSRVSSDGENSIGMDDDTRGINVKKQWVVSSN